MTPAPVPKAEAMNATTSGSPPSSETSDGMSVTMGSTPKPTAVTPTSSTMRSGCVRRYRSPSRTLPSPVRSS